MDRNRWKAQCQILICAAVLDAAILGLMAGTVQVRAGAADSRKELSLAEDQAILPDTGRILPAGSPEMTAEEGKENSRFAALGSVVALTFDDGPHKIYTKQLLDGLRERGIHATFFLMGSNIEGKEDIVKRMSEEGHLIGNHSYEHIQLTKAGPEAVCEAVEHTQEQIEAITGKRPEYIRPPYGDWNEELEEEIGMSPVLWSVDSLDWKLKDKGKIVRRVLKDVKDGDIILMHDIFPSSVEAALELVDILQKEGYVFVTADELLIE